MSKSVDKAIAVLNCFSLERSILGVGEISRLTGYTKSTVSRLLTTLQSHGCVERAGGQGIYQLGYRIHLWADMGARQNNLVNIARPVMEKLRDTCGEEIALYVIEGDRRVCVERVECLHEIAKVGPVGTYYPLHAGASGKVLLAYLSQDRRNAIISKGRLEKYTARTITDNKKLEKDLKDIRKLGYAISRGEREPDAFSVTAPIWAAGGRIVASISISGPNFRRTDKQLKKDVQEILDASKEISNKLGYINT
jgi:DNA-binding IclR family transcriptional regulator